MSPRFLALAPLAPAVAVIAFAAASAAAPDGVEPSPANAIVDLRFGERGEKARLVLVCRRDCRLAPRAGDVFFLPDVDAALEINLASRSQHIEALRIEPAEGGAILSLRARGSYRIAPPARCVVAGAPATCLDIAYAAAPATKAASEPGPALRDARDARLVFAEFEPPERFEAPAPAAPVRPTPASLPKEPTAPAPIIRTEIAEKLVSRDVDIAAEAARILDKRINAETCKQAKTKLKADAWALDAMVDVGFCLADSGDHEEADGVFKRLLAYTPDRYDALVGRALIAAKLGDRSIARKYFQDALDATPPLAESRRIAEAARRL